MESEISLDASARKYIFISLRVVAKDLKLVFQELSALFKKTTSSKSFVIKCVNGSLMVRASTNIEYAAYPACLSGDVEDFEVACLFQDVHELIDNRGEITITVTPTYLELSQSESAISFNVVDFVVVSLPKVEGVGTEIKTKKLIDCLKTLLKLAPASAVYKKSVTLLLSGDRAQVRFPSVWIETESEGLVLPMETSIANIVLNFLSNTDSVYLLTLNQWTALTKGISTIFIPIKDEVKLKSINEITKDFNYIGEFSLDGFQNEIQKLLRAVGKADCKIYLFEESIRVEVRTENIQVNHVRGKEDSKLLDSFTMRLEFLNSVLLTLGDLVQIYGKGDYRCIKAAKALVLISSQG